MRYKDDSLSLHTDLYQINMVEAYREAGIDKKKAVFEVYFRKNPFGNGYVVFAGLERVINYLKEFRFTDSDLEYLNSLGYEESFLNYLKEMRFTGTIRSLEEGQLTFPNVPMMRIETTLAEAQIIETALLNVVNFQSLIATKASRIKQIIPNETALEFGTRRAQEMDASIWGARAAYLAGFDATSNVRAGKIFDIPVAGTHAHALIQAFQDDYKAFKAYAKKHKNCVFLVDTYDTLNSGVPAAIKVAQEEDIHFIGIRLDSGDLAYLSKEARKMLDKAGFTEAKITASNDLDEETILHLKSQGAKIDSWGIGTKLITAFDQPALGAVYKMVAIENEVGELEPTIKISANPEKVSTPGLKRVYRILNKQMKAEGEYIMLEGERFEGLKDLEMFNPVHIFQRKTVENFTAVDLHQTIFEKGKLIYQVPSIEESRLFLKRNLESFWAEYKRITNPEIYPVDLSRLCWEQKMNKIDEVRNKRS